MGEGGLKKLFLGGRGPKKAVFWKKTLSDIFFKKSQAPKRDMSRYILEPLKEYDLTFLSIIISTNSFSQCKESGL